MIYLLIDTEFTDFNPMELISLGIISEDGAHEAYVEINDHNPNIRSSFVNQVIVPLLDMKTYGKTYLEAASYMVGWINNLPGTTVTIMVDYVGDYQLCDKLLKAGPQLDKHVSYKTLSLGFVEMCQERGYHTNTELILRGYRTMLDSAPEYFKQDPRQHHALVDAKAARHGWVEGYKKVTSA